VERRQFERELEILFDAQALAVLATDSGESPYTSLVAFVAANDFRELVFATGRGTRKFDNMGRNARVSMLIDSRSHQVSDFRDAVAVTALGRVREITGAEREDYVVRYLTKHPYLKRFVNAPSCALMAIAVNRYIMVSRFQEVTQLSMDDPS
jgi:nitroimidazol reductase NimA-like FMN-containing flavoprotein (pyridoxamine 5'-phosphate oxidase superfamily)